MVHLLYASERLTPKNNFAEVWKDGNFKKQLRYAFFSTTKLSDDHSAK